MTKFQDKSFSVPLGGKAFRDGYDRAFGNKELREVAFNYAVEKCVEHLQTAESPLRKMFKVEPIEPKKKQRKRRKK